MRIDKPYLLFLGDAPDALSVKVARGIAHWRPRDCVGQLRLPGCRADLGIEDLTPAAAAARGARTLVVGVANRGGVIGEAWVESLLRALDAGLDLASGLHDRLSDIAALADAARDAGRRLHEVRHPSPEWLSRLDVATGRPRSGRRLLTVGTDCSVGKMYTTLAIHAELQARGVPADFRATGQAGILIAGSGVAVDAVVSDFIAGAAELLAPAAEEDHWDLIEGQGSLLHPSFAGVTLGLIHGAQAEALVLCHEPTRAHMRGLAHFAMPDLGECMELTLRAARLTCPRARFVGISVNTSGLDAPEATALLAGTAERFGLPAVDPLRGGVAPIVDALLA